ncbi:MAG: DUF4169 family protein [Pseudomonadota bacterium]
MGDIINLRQRRKALKRQAERVVADRNAIAHGLPKRVTNLAEARRRKADAALDARRLDTPSRRDSE